MSSKDHSSASHNGKNETIVPEFSRRVPLVKIGRPTEHLVKANKVERQALVERFGLLSLDELICRFLVKQGEGDVVLAEGTITARAEQACIITGEAVPEKIKETFYLRFVPYAQMPDDDALDIEALLQEDADDVPHDGKAIDLGEAAAEQLALCLEPYPRVQGSGLEQFVDVTPAEEESESVEETQKPNPFDVLKKLKEKGMKE